MRADRPGVGMRRNDRLFGNFRHVIKQSVAGMRRPPRWRASPSLSVLPVQRGGPKPCPRRRPARFPHSRSASSFYAAVRELFQIGKLSSQYRAAFYCQNRRKVSDRYGANSRRNFSQQPSNKAIAAFPRSSSGIHTAKHWLHRSASLSPFQGPGESGFPPTAGSPYIPGIKESQCRSNSFIKKAPFRRSA